MNRSLRCTTMQAGYSLIEMVFVTAIMSTIAAIAVVQIGTTSQQMKGDAAMRVVLSQVNQARELAIMQRRYIQVTFDVVNSQFSLVREDTINTTTTLGTMLFEGGAKFLLPAGVADTPDAFGNGQATTFSNPTNGTFPSASGTTKVIKFAPDGTLVDWNGVVTNGTVFTSVPGMNGSVRAVTILGSTGRVRGYRWSGTKWTQV